MPSNVIPQKIRPFVALGVSYSSLRPIGNELEGDCPFCGASRKFYINCDTGQWECKRGACGLSGNIYSYLKQWYAMHAAKGARTSPLLDVLSTERKLPRSYLDAAGVLEVGGKWYLPVYNSDGALVNLRIYTTGRGLIGVPGLDVALWGVDRLSDDQRPVVVCEGEWDGIALRGWANEQGWDIDVLGVPGAGTWKDAWTVAVKGRRLFLAYDHDEAGLKGMLKVRRRLSDAYCIAWDSTLPDGYDIRDAVSSKELPSDEEEFFELFQQSTPCSIEGGALSGGENVGGFIEAVRGRPLPAEPLTWAEVEGAFRERLEWSSELSGALRCIAGTFIANNLVGGGDPAWLHIVAPPGAAKTELLMSLVATEGTHFASSLTPHSLVSGYVTLTGEDPSLLPKLAEKVLIVKDFTEVLQMDRRARDELYGVLRGAYDGTVEKMFGNGVYRQYNCTFGVISGVTHAIYGDRSASLGERFLMYHMIKGAGIDQEAVIRAAIKGVGKESGTREELAFIMRAFMIGNKLNEHGLAIPILPDTLSEQLVSLSELVAMLRGTVEKVQSMSGGGPKVLYRAQYEVGTRLGKQLVRLLYGLAYLHRPAVVLEEDYRLVCRVALDTCHGINLEMLAVLMADSSKSGVTADELVTVLGLNLSTIHDQLDDLYQLKIITRERQSTENVWGTWPYVYKPSDRVRYLWKTARLSGSATVTDLERWRLTTFNKQIDKK